MYFMKTIRYNIQFFSNWHCGSGLSAGADVDELVVKDKDGMPYVPGKTMKGLIREAVEDYVFLTGGDSAAVDETFGSEADMTGSAFFSNATLDEREQMAIVSNGAQKFMYNKVTTTAIGEDGIAKEHSLHSLETVVPCSLTGFVADVPETMVGLIGESLGMIKRIGLRRSRGLDRCDVTLVEGGEI